jgi:DtxR family Mn-dependent transcriptional regulator
MLDERAQMYLKAVAGLSEEGERATTSSIARRLGVSQPSVTEMLQRLSAKGLVSHKPRGPVRLTKEGERLATSLVRRHRLWENFLARFLGFSWEEVHDEACELEHATSPALEERLAALMGDLEACPHGHAIPGRKGRAREERAIPLSEFSVPGPARVVRLREETADFLHRLARLDISPGCILETEGASAKDGSVQVRVEGRPVELAADLAKIVMVKPAEKNGAGGDQTRR